jgi:hypothetical protein
VATLVGAVLCATPSRTPAFPFPGRGPSLTATASELSKTLGNSVSIHVAPEMEGSPIVPAVCKVVIEAIRDATHDEQSRERISRGLNVVLIEGQKTTMHEHFVTLKEHILTIQSVNDLSSIPKMRSLLADVLKEFVQRDEKMEPAK